MLRFVSIIFEGSVAKLGPAAAGLLCESDIAVIVKQEENNNH